MVDDLLKPIVVRACPIHLRAAATSREDVVVAAGAGLESIEHVGPCDRFELGVAGTATAPGLKVDVETREYVVELVGRVVATDVCATSGRAPQ